MVAASITSSSSAHSVQKSIQSVPVSAASTRVTWKTMPRPPSKSPNIGDSGRKPRYGGRRKLPDVDVGIDNLDRKVEYPAAVYSWGNGGDYRLGTGDNRSRANPTLILLSRCKVSFFESSHTHTLSLSLSHTHTITITDSLYLFLPPPLSHSCTRTKQ